MEFLYRLYKYSEHKILIIIVLSSLSGALGMYTYGHIYKIGWEKSVLYTLELFAMDVKHPAEVKELIWLENNNSKNFVNQNGEINATYYADDCIKISHITHSWKLIYLAGFFATLTLVVGVFLLFFRSLLSLWYRKNIIRNGEHTIVIGLGRNSRFFINSMEEEYPHKVIVFEIDEHNPYIEIYQEKKVSVVLHDVDSMIDELNLDNVKNVFISTGSDEKNLYYALQFIDRLEGNTEFGKLLIHIDDRTLRNLYSDDGALKSSRIDIKIFSYYKDAARLLFQEHPLEGEYNKKKKDNVIDTFTPFQMVVIGNSELSISLVAEACRLAHYPNNNKLHIYCIDSDIKSLSTKFYYSFPEIEKVEENLYNIENIDISFIELESGSIEFYKHEVWENSKIKHIVCCYDDIIRNISIVTKLKDVTYLNLRREKLYNFEHKFHIATMNHKKVAKKVESFNLNSENKNLFTFAQADVICSQKNLLCNHIDEMAKMMHYCYDSWHCRDNEIEINENAMEEKWKKASIYEKRSSLGQAIHLDTKLRVMGLKKLKVSSTEDTKLLQRENKRMIDRVFAKDMERLALSEDKLYEMEQAYKNRYKEEVKDGFFFPKKYGTEFEKVLRMEHNRWMTVLKLMDNVKDEKAVSMRSEERKKLKVHHLLKPFSEFETNHERIYVINDYNTIKNVARYMALTHYKIVNFYEC